MDFSVSQTLEISREPQIFAYVVSNPPHEADEHVLYSRVLSSSSCWWNHSVEESPRLDRGHKVRFLIYSILSYQLSGGCFCAFPTWEIRAKWLALSEREFYAGVGRGLPLILLWKHLSYSDTALHHHHHPTLLIHGASTSTSKPAAYGVEATSSSLTTFLGKITVSLPFLLR